MENELSITFVVLTFNHADYVVVHLESIAAIVINYNQIKLHDLVISDDASQDSTTVEVSKWLNQNHQIFRSVTTFFNSKNVGTCNNFLKATENIRTAFVKATGGDDLFSDEDIFSELKKSGKAEIIGSQPLTLIEDELYRFSFFNILHAASNAVYANTHFRRLLVRHSAIYTPGLIYSANLICDERIRKFIGKYVLVEDRPCWIAITECYPSVKYWVSDKHLVYYRRTRMSAYLIAGRQVFNDQLKCLQYLSNIETSFFSRYLIGNRIWLMNKCPNQLKAFCDLGKLIFIIELILKFPSFLFNIKLLGINLKKHKAHYNRMKENAVRFKA